MENRTNYLFNAIIKLPVFKEYIDLRNIAIKSSTDLVKIAYTFRNPVYETFRIIYMCDNKIVGYESVTSRMPNLCNIFNLKTNRMNNQDITRNCIEMVNRMFRLGANGYYLMHNHPSGSARASKPDIEITKKIANSVSGFLGHVIVDHGTFSWIDYQNGKIRVSDDIPIVNSSQLKVDTPCTSNPLLTPKITSRNDLARLMYDVKHSKNYSLLICTNTINRIRLIQEIPNCFMNINLEQLAGYIRNQAKMCGSTKAFITTSSLKVFQKACDLKHNGNLTDCIAYNTVDDVIKLLAKDDTDITQDIFQKSKSKPVAVGDKENIYVEDDHQDIKNSIKEQAEKLRDSLSSDETFGYITLESNKNENK